MAQSNIPLCPFEHIDNPEQEAAQIAETTDITVQLLDKRYPPPEKILRGVHPKSHGCVKATFSINEDIDPELQVGLFAVPGKGYAAHIRFSNAAALVGPDIDAQGKHGSRGMAIKVFDVGGDVISDDNGANNQDFLMINQPMFAFANSEDYLRLDRVLLRNNDNPEAFFAPLKLNDPALNEEQKQRILAYMAAENIAGDDVQRILNTFKIIQQIQATAVANPFDVQYFSAAPFLFGKDRVMKFSVKPRQGIDHDRIPENPSGNYLAEALAETMNKAGEIEFDFIVQVRAGDGEMGIENASSLWDEADYPFIPVAKVVIPAPQPDINSDENKAYCESLAYTPWHSLVEHQPIGSINRLRKSVYEASAEHRLQNKDSFVQFLEKFFKSIFG
jgi:catalase